MKIEIEKRSGGAVLISFNTEFEKFSSASERNRFFWALHGRRQVVVKSDKRYEYHREGLLESTPHIKVDNSVFIIMQEHLKRMKRFFEEWEDKVEFKTFPVLLDRQALKELQKQREIKIE